MNFDVFISYSTKDATAAKATCAALEAARIRCWIAPRDIVPSASWGASIVRAINQCRVMVLIFSAKANESKQVHREVNQAFSKGKTVVPLRIEDIQPADELAYYLDTVHWLDAITPPLETNLGQLVATVGALLSAGEPAPKAVEATTDDMAAAQAQDQARVEDERRERQVSGEQNGQGAKPKQRVNEREGRRRADLLVKAEVNRLVGHRWRPWVLNPSLPVIVGALALPAIISAASLAPPWPSQTTAMTTVLEALGIAFTYYYLRNRPRAARFVTIAGGTLLVALACLYLLSVSSLTYQISTRGGLYAKGLVCSADALLVYKEKCPNLGIDELKGAGYDAERLWTSQSITIVKMRLLMLWLGAFMMMAALVGSFMAHSALAMEKSNPKSVAGQ
jgi:hypothetical protein